MGTLSTYMKKILGLTALLLSMNSCNKHFIDAIKPDPAHQQIDTSQYRPTVSKNQTYVFSYESLQARDMKRLKNYQHPY